MYVHINIFVTVNHNKPTCSLINREQTFCSKSVNEEILIEITRQNQNL